MATVAGEALSPAQHRRRARRQARDKAKLEARERLSAAMNEIQLLRVQLQILVAALKSAGTPQTAGPEACQLRRWKRRSRLPPIPEEQHAPVLPDCGVDGAEDEPRAQALRRGRWPVVTTPPRRVSWISRKGTLVTASANLRRPLHPSHRRRPQRMGQASKALRPRARLPTSPAVHRRAPPPEGSQASWTGRISQKCSSSSCCKVLLHSQTERSPGSLLHENFGNGWRNEGSTPSMSRTRPAWRDWQSGTSTWSSWSSGGRRLTQVSG